MGTTGYRTCGRDGCEVQQFLRMAAGYCRGETAGSRAWGKFSNLDGCHHRQPHGDLESQRPPAGASWVWSRGRYWGRTCTEGPGTCKTEVVRREPGKEPASKASGPITSDKTRKVWELGANETIPEGTGSLW